MQAARPTSVTKQPVFLIEAVYYALRLWYETSDANHGAHLLTSQPPCEQENVRLAVNRRSLAAYHLLQDWQAVHAYKERPIE